MRSLFLKLFLCFCAAIAIAVVGVVIGYTLNNPDQLPFGWPRVGQGAVVSSGRTAIAAYERGGTAELLQYLESLRQDTGMRGALLDSSGRELSGALFDTDLLPKLSRHPESKLVIRAREHAAGVRLHGRDNAEYEFIAALPRRETTGFWSRTFLASFLVIGALLCFPLARYMTAPVVHLRALTSRFSAGDLSARVTKPEILERNDEIGGLARDFNQMAARVETLMRAQQRLIADVSHELRSPITRLSLALGLLDRKAEPEARTSLARMHREVERLNSLIAQLLMLSRLECLEQPPPMETFDLSALVSEVANDADFEAAGMDRRVVLAECAACTMRGARDLVQSAIENIVRNALKYTCPNTQVAIRLARANGSQSATVAVADHGPGVPADALDQIFKPFYRVDEARDRRSGGAGLGLAIAWQIVKLHGGDIRAANRQEGGLEMRVSLPVEAVFDRVPPRR